MAQSAELNARLTDIQEQLDKWQGEVDNNPEDPEPVIERNLWQARKEEIEFAIGVLDNL